jgi:cellulose biosynthesis protein BcsQ
MSRTVALLNQKGGVGKTTVTLGLASAAAEAGQTVLVVDLDPQCSSTWVLGIDPSGVDTSTAEVFGKSAPEDVILPSAWNDYVHVMPGSARLQERERGKPRRLRNALESIAEHYDAVLIDCPPSLGNLTTSGLTAADHALVVAEPSALGLRGIASVADMIDSVWDEHNPGLDLAGVIVNKVPAVSTEAERRYDELTRAVGKRAVWSPSIPLRVIVNQATGDRRPIHSYGARSADVSVAFDQLWKRLRKLLRD